MNNDTGVNRSKVTQFEVSQMMISKSNILAHMRVKRALLKVLRAHLRVLRAHPRVLRAKLRVLRANFEYTTLLEWNRATPGRNY